MVHLDRTLVKQLHSKQGHMSGDIDSLLKLTGLDVTELKHSAARSFLVHHLLYLFFALSVFISFENVFTFAGLECNIN